MVGTLDSVSNKSFEQSKRFASSLMTGILWERNPSTFANNALLHVLDRTFHVIVAEGKFPEVFVGWWTGRLCDLRPDHQNDNSGWI